MITDDEIEATRRYAEESKHKRGTLGVWARRWLQLHERLVLAERESARRGTLVQALNDDAHQLIAATNG